jgi:hypothetical protein
MQGDGKGNAITTGGGFSAFYLRPTWQDKAVRGYFTAAAAASQSPLAGYSTNGRGLPDISLAGKNYEIYVRGKIEKVQGTSASCPAFAGFISTINAARIAEGKGSVGHLNPALYVLGPYFTYDITSGSNFCVGDGTCCRQGYYAAPGWDPTTGLGSVNYSRMASVLVDLGVPTSPPVAVPAAMPVKTPVAAPVAAPAAMPLGAKTVPTPVPTPVPTSPFLDGPAAMPVKTPVAAPVAAGSPLTGYFISAAYSDTACSVLIQSIAFRLNTCTMNSDKTSRIYNATSAEIFTMEYTDSNCKSSPVISRKSYTGLCSGSSRIYASALSTVSSTAPSVAFRSVCLNQ